MNKNESFRYKHYLRVVERLKINKISPVFGFEEYKGVKNHYNLKCGVCSFIFISSFDNGYTPKCPKCFPNRLNINIGHPKNIDVKCEYCNKLFHVIWKKRKQRFCSVECKCEFIKKNKREIINCLACNKQFERYKNILHQDTGKPAQYCSNKCNRSSQEKKNKLKLWISKNNPMNNQVSIDNIGKTKLQKYGTPSYNNINKCQQTMLSKYGVSCGFYLPQCKSNGKRVSGFQKRIFVEIKKLHPDAELEKYLPDVKKAVDIYIPSIRKVIECHGDYWHCNPVACKPDYYNKLVHLTASEIWKKDQEKKILLENSGYTVEVIWENANKRFKH